MCVRARAPCFEKTVARSPTRFSRKVPIYLKLFTSKPLFQFCEWIIFMRFLVIPNVTLCMFTFIWKIISIVVTVIHFNYIVARIFMTSMLMTHKFVFYDMDRFFRIFLLTFVAKTFLFFCT